MKTLPVAVLLAAASAFLFAPISFELAGSILVTLAFGAILAADYARSQRVLKPALSPAEHRAAHRSPFRLAV